MTEEELYGGNQLRQVAYEGASENYRVGQRGLLEGDADTLAARELLNLQMRSAHAIRNNGTAKAAQLKRIIALGAITVNWKGADKLEHPLMQELWDEFIKNPNLDGHGDFRGTQALWNNSIFQAGAALTNMLFQKTGNTNRVPLKLQAIPTEMLDVLYNGDQESDKIRHGIKFVNSKPVTYYFRKGIYNEQWLGIANKAVHTKIPANDIVHIFDRISPSQWLGVPELSSVLMSLYELDDLIDATVAKQKAAQAVAWIVENTNPLNMNSVGVVKQVTDTATAEDQMISNSAAANTQYMQKGEKIHFSQGTDIGSNLPVLIKMIQQTIASAQSLPYHSLTGDTSGLDFSSLRAIAIDLRSALTFIHHVRTIPLGIAPVTKRFKEYAALHFDVKDAEPTFQLPRWFGVDDLKDGQADLLKVSMGSKTFQRVLEENHLTLAEIEESKAMLDKVGLGHLMEKKTESGKQTGNVEPNANSTTK